MIGVDPYGSILAEHEELNETSVSVYQVQYGNGSGVTPQKAVNSIVKQFFNGFDTCKLYWYTDLYVICAVLHV